MPGLASAWDATALDALLTFGFVPPPATLHPAIRQLAPAEMAVWESGRLRFQRYWHLAFPERRLAAAEAAALVREQAREAIRLRLAGEVAALLLSDGLDAAALLALAAAFSLAFAGSPARIAEGVRIAGVDVGGLTPSEARRMLERRSAALENVPVTFFAAGRRWRLRPRTLGVEADWAAAVDAARRGEPRFLEARSRVAGERLAVELGERTPAPQGERFSQPLRRRPRIARG
jgi:hypothetical protein